MKPTRKNYLPVIPAVLFLCLNLAVPAFGAAKNNGEGEKAKMPAPKTSVSTAIKGKEAPAKKPSAKPDAVKKTAAAAKGTVKAASSSKQSAALPSGVVSYPRNFANLNNQRPTVGADYQNLPNSIKNIDSVLLLDGEDVTKMADRGPGYIFYTSASDLTQGKHTALLKLSANNGSYKREVQWSFSISGAAPLRFAYPAPDNITKNTTPIIGLNFKNLPEDVDSKTARLILNGRDVTSESDVTDSYILYVPKTSLAAGRHNVEAIFRNSAGTTLKPLAWSFSVAGPPVVATQQPAASASAPEAVKKPAEKQAPKSPKNITVAASALTGATRYENQMAAATTIAEAIATPVPVFSAQTTVTAAAAETPAPSQTAPVETAAENVQYLPPQIAQSGYVPISNRLQYAVETTYGVETMAINGDTERSSQRTHNAFFYQFGLRTQLPPSKEKSKTIFRTPQFNMNIRMEGTTDGDDSETIHQLKKLSGVLESKRENLTFYDIQPKYSSYSMSGQWLEGAEFTHTLGNTKYDLFTGKFKKARAGRNINLSGFRVSTQRTNGLLIGAHFVANDLKDANGIADSIKNSLYGFNFEKKIKQVDTKFEWATSKYSDLGDDKAYRLETAYRKNKLSLSSNYENVGSAFRTEGGFASYGLVEFRSSMQYQFSKQFTSVLGFWRRTFRDGVSHTVSYPLVFKMVPFSKRPSTGLEYRFKLTYYDKGATWKDTTSNSLDLTHKIGTSSAQVSYKLDQTQRNNSDDENERLLNLNLQSPITKKATLTYKMSKLNNNFYGPESKNTYGASYDLSDWSDVRISFEKANKVQDTLDRTTQKINFGLVDPNNNTEISLEYNRNLFLLYQENLFNFKYSIFY
ncbi:MAG: hypothetical protein WCX65_18685 [bacterium]